MTPTLLFIIRGCLFLPITRKERLLLFSGNSKQNVVVQQTFDFSINCFYCFISIICREKGKTFVTIFSIISKFTSFFFATCSDYKFKLTFFVSVLV